MKNYSKIFVAVIATTCYLLNYSTANAQKSSDDAEWTISAINLEDNSMKDSLQNVPVFEDANINCLLNSTWAFMGEGEGYYKIDQANVCSKGMRNISWKRFKIKGSDYLQFFRTSAVRGIRADEYSLYICEVSAS
ncbi:MAG TPA: hypothetical protein VGI61_13985, partial [Parafilimonas sp.]